MAYGSNERRLRQNVIIQEKIRHSFRQRADVGVNVGLAGPFESDLTAHVNCSQAIEPYMMCHESFINCQMSDLEAGLRPRIV